MTDAPEPYIEPYTTRVKFALWTTPAVAWVGFLLWKAMA